MNKVITCPSCEYENELGDSKIIEEFEEECKQCGRRFLVSPDNKE